MNTQNLYKLTRMRNERNDKLDMVAEKLSHRVVKGQPDTFSSLYTIQHSEAEELIRECYSIPLLATDLVELINNSEKERIQTSIADSIYISPEHPIGDEEMAFLSINHNDMHIRTTKIRNLFIKSEFNTLDFLKRLSTIISEIVVDVAVLPQEIQNNKVVAIIKCICCVIFTASKLIQGMTIDFDDKYSAILYYLIDNENGMTGVEKDSIVEYLQSQFADIDEAEINRHINDLDELGCIKIDDANSISLKERVIRIKGF